ncbi:hypothetical protein GWK47_029390 [Chionoecetes opilio]|uniref:Uncharacterized protein n=1 Tax=Chionoecetes opilio TaxID=41210 RepID=A0A8J4YSJ1_CHIOP|nr:hypothetical protein GWK47_029390 [Chionoecetes opilio]
MSRRPSLQLFPPFFFPRRRQFRRVRGGSATQVPLRFLTPRRGVVKLLRGGGVWRRKLGAGARAVNRREFFSASRWGVWVGGRSVGGGTNRPDIPPHWPRGCAG